jgi:hypothetical protein
MFFMTLGLEIAGSLYLAHHAKTGDIALTRLREAMAGEVAAAVTQSDPLNRAAAVQNLHVDGELEHRLRDTVAYTQLEVRARETWLHPILRSGLLVTTADIGGESIEDVQRHRAQFREFANEEAGFRYSIDWDNITGWAIRILPLSIPPILWILWTFLTRGGLVLRFGGLSLVNSRGQPASRLRCAWRTLLVWLPITVLLFTAVQLEAWYWDVWQPGDPHVWAPWIFWASWWAALAMLLSYVVLALWFPVRGLHDGLAGTYVVPR